MPAIQRKIYSHVKKQLLAKERLIQVLVGPRQIGKTTLVQQILNEWPGPKLSVTADAIPGTDSRWLEQQWNVARTQLQQSTDQEFLLVIDEIQKIDNWSETIKKLWDEDRIANLPLKVILLGSSRLLIQQGLTESLAGRFERTYLGHWSLSEMQSAFGVTLEEYVWFGGYPGAAQLMEDEERWRRYVNDSLLETSISKDVLMLTQVAKPALLRRLFELGSRYSGQILSFTKFMGQLADAGNTVTLSRYLDMLDTAGLLGGLEKFSPDMVRQRASSPKFQVHNNAMLSVLSLLTFKELMANPKEKGRWVESAVGVHLLNQSLEQGFNLYYWRDRNEEVDFIMERRGKIAAIEVKSGADKAVPGLKKFTERYPQTKSYATGSSGIPLADFLNLDPMQLFG